MFRTKVNMATFTICVLGEKGVGKTTFLHRHVTGHFNGVYTPTHAPQMYNLHWQTNYGKVSFHVWDGESDKHQAVIIMFDLTTPSSYQNVKSWIESSAYDTESAPFVICGNKCDLQRQVQAHDIHQYIIKENCAYYDISAKSKYNYNEPFLYLARKLLNKDDLQFVE